MADVLPADTTSPAIAELIRPGVQPETPEERAFRLEHLINPTAEDWARIEARHVKASEGVRAEYAHLLYDADPDLVTRPFPYPGESISDQLIDGGES